MVIIGKRAEGYVIECGGRGLIHRFVVKGLGLEVRCPSCGEREASLDLANSYIFTRRTNHFGGNPERRKPRAARPADFANDDFFARHGNRRDG